MLYTPLLLAQLVEHLTVVFNKYRIVAGSIPAGETFLNESDLLKN